MNTIENTGEDFAAQTLTHTAHKIHHLLRLKDNKGSLENITAMLKADIEGAYHGMPDVICDKMILQAHIFDAAFQRYIDNACTNNSIYEYLDFAMKLQNQMLRTAHTWKRIKTPPSQKTRGTN